MHFLARHIYFHIQILIFGSYINPIKKEIMIRKLIIRYKQWRERRLRKWCVKMAVKGLKAESPNTAWYSAKLIYDFINGTID